MEDKEQLKENLKKIYRALPDRVKDAILAPETSAAYDRVAERYQLTPAQREILSIQSGLLMMGLRLPQELVPTLSSMLNLPREKVSLMAQELNRDIFNPIKDDLKQIHEIEDTPILSTQPSVATPKAPSPLTTQTPVQPQAARNTILPMQTVPATVPTKVEPSVLQVSRQTPPPTVVAPTVPTPVPSTPAPTTSIPTSIFEQKMSGAFRMPTQTPPPQVPQAVSGAISFHMPKAPSDTPTLPVSPIPAPQMVTPPPPQPTIAPVPQIDPYREQAA